MSRTGDEALIDFSRFLEDYWESETDADGSSDFSTLVDSEITDYGSDTLEGGFIRITEPGHADLYSVRRIRTFDADGAAMRVERPYTGQIDSGVAYQFHRHDPRRKMDALNRARLLAFPQVSLVLLDETKTSDGQNNILALPAEMRTGPVQVWGETPLGVGQSWNLLPQNEWTAGSGSTLSTFASSPVDLLIPRRAASCNVWVVTGSSETTLSLTAANLQHDYTAALLAGRQVTVGVWVFCRVANRLTLRVTDDAAAYVSDVSHSGRGWQFLTVTFNVSPTNTTLFTTAIVAAAGTADVWVAVEETYGMTGERVPIDYSQSMTKRGTWRDASHGVVILDEQPARGQQLQLVGRRPITDMGTTHALMSTATVEVDVENQELWFAKAARLFYTGMGLRTGQINEQFPKITEVEERFKEMAPDFGVKVPFSDSVRVW